MISIGIIQNRLDNDLNLLLAAHGGRVDILRRNGRVIEVTMSGGCQGCAGAKYTLSMMVKAFIQNIDPSVEDVVDVTDHASGESPFYKQETEQQPSANDDSRTTE